METNPEKIRDILKRVGLNGNEAKVYITLLKTGSSKAGNISKNSQINRTTTYDALKHLLDKGLINYVVKENRKWFEANDPKRLLEYLKEKEEEVENILPALNKMQSMPKEKHDITLYYGYKGVKTVFMDIIREGYDNDVFGDEGYLNDKLPGFSKFFIKQQDKNKRKTRLITGVKDIEPYSKGTTYRYMPLKALSPVATNIYNDKIAIIIWTDPPEAIIIKNKEAADSYKNYFEFLWRAGEKIDVEK
ncbi:MAG: hypothetical protein KAS90_00100 [Candidatus Aenigmarchaeota archaeon]|nr:hypothetical protein [Candidatus Aenigmarchaeota archaeon]